jgi:cytochrome c-type biogenesis protein CcmH/NrfG
VSDPGSTDAVERALREAEVARVTGGPARAAGLLRAALAGAPGDPRLLLALTDALAADGALDEAEATAREAAAVLPESAEPLLALAHVLLKRPGDGPRRAGETAREALRLAPDETRAHLTVALAAGFDPSATRADRDRARPSAEEALRLAPDLPGAHVVAGLLDRVDDPARAEIHLRRALALDPHQQEALTLLAGLSVTEEGAAAGLLRTAAAQRPLDDDTRLRLEATVRGAVHRAAVIAPLVSTVALLGAVWLPVSPGIVGMLAPMAFLVWGALRTVRTVLAAVPRSFVRRVLWSDRAGRLQTVADVVAPLAAAAGVLALGTGDGEGLPGVALVLLASVASAVGGTVLNDRMAAARRSVVAGAEDIDESPGAAEVAAVAVRSGLVVVVGVLWAAGLVANPLVAAAVCLALAAPLAGAALVAARRGGGPAWLRRLAAGTVVLALLLGLGGTVAEVVSGGAAARPGGLTWVGVPGGPEERDALQRQEDRRQEEREERERQEREQGPGRLPDFGSEPPRAPTAVPTIDVPDFTVDLPGAGDGEATVGP